MAKIAQQRRQITPSGRTGVERVPAYPQPSRRVGAETQRLGQVLRGIGGAFGSLAGKLQEVQYDNDILTAKNSLTADYKTFTDAIAGDDDYAGREDKFYTWFDATTKEYATATRSQRAKRDLSNYFAGQRTRMGIQVSTQAQSLLVKDTRLKSETWLSSAEQAWATTTDPEEKALIESSVKAHLNKLDADDIYVDGWIEQREIDFLTNAKDLAYDKLKKDAYDTGFDMLLNAGLDAAISHVLDRKNFTGLTPGDRHAVIKRLQIDEKLGEFEDWKREEAEDAALVNEMTEMLSKDEGRALVDFVATLEDGITKTKWTKVVDGFTRPAKKTKYDKYLPLEEAIFDVWLKKTSVKDYQNDLAQALGAKSLTHDDYNILLDRMKLKPDPKDIGLLQEAFDMLAKKGTLFGRVSGGKLGEKLADTRAALLDWYRDRRDKKKEITQEDVLKAALQFYSGTRGTPADRVGAAIAENNWDVALTWMHWGETALSPDVALRVNELLYEKHPARPIVEALRSFPDPSKVTVGQLNKALKVEPKIRVRHPDGRTGLVPADQRDAAIVEGYEIIE